VSVLGVAGAATTTAADGSYQITGLSVTAGQTLTLVGTMAAPTGQPLYMEAQVAAVAGGLTDAGNVLLAFECYADFTGGLFPTNSLNGTVDALMPFGSGLVAAGSFTSALIAGTVTSGVNRIALWNGTTWAKLGTGISGGSSPVVSALAVFGGQLYVGGTFTSAGSVTVANVARWNGSSWSAVGSGLPGAVEALAVWNGALYAGGAFTTSGSVHYNHVAQWNGSAWVAVGAGFDSDVLAFATFDDGSGGGTQLYAGGKFVSGGLNGVARWNATGSPATWVEVGGGVSGTSTPLVDAFATTVVAGAPALLAGGSFTAAGGVPSAGVAQWSGGTWSAAGGGGPGSRVYGLAVFDLGDGEGPLAYAAGSFGSPFERLASWDLTADGWQPVYGASGTAGFDNTAEALAAWTAPGTPAPPAGLFLGGAFGKAGGVTSYRMARWELPATCSAPSAPPALAMTAPGAATANARPSIDFAYQGFDATVVTGSLALSLNGQPLAASCTFGAGTAACVPPAALADGTYSVEATVVDSAGNAGSASGQFIVDSVPPAVAIVAPTEAATVPPSQTLRLAWSDAGSGIDGGSVALHANGGALAASCTADAIGAVCTPSQALSAGAVTLTATVRDRAGNTATSAPRHVTVSGSTTTVSGTVETAAGAPAAGAGVSVLGVSGAIATTQADGTFQIAGVPFASGSTLTVAATLAVGTARLAAVAANLTPVAGGTTAAGVLTLAPACGPGFVDQLFPGTGVSGDDGQHRNVQGVVGWNDGSGPALYAWGDFSYAGGAPVNGAAKWDGTRWQPLAGLTGGLGALVVADLGSGGGGLGLYALGAPTLSWQGSALGGIARESGSAWTAVGGGTDGTVSAAVEFDDGSGPALFVAGTFQHIGVAGASLAAPGTARWNGASWSAVPATADGSVDRFAVANGVLYGVVDAGPAGGSEIWQWASPAGWTLVRVFSDFVSAAGVVATGGGSGSPPGLYVGHTTTVERWDGASWTVVSPSGGSAAAGALFGFDDGTGSGARLYLAGTFCAASCGTPPAGVFVWDGSAWSTIGVNPDTASEGPTAIGAWNDGTANRLVAAGQFLRTPAGRQANGLAELVGGALVPLGSQTVEGATPDVRAMVVWDDGTGPALYVGGRFASVGGVAARDIARWDGTTWSALGGGIGQGAADDVVSALEVYNGALYAGGLFSVAGSQPIADLAQWDGWEWSGVVGVGGVAATSWVQALRAWNGVLVAGGPVGQGGVLATGIAQWDGTAWSGLGSGIDGLVSARGTRNQIEALAVYGGALYVAGNFSSVSGVAANNVARWDGAAWTSLGDPGSFEIKALQVYDAGDGGGARLYLGGYWNDPTTPASLSYLASWDGTTLAPAEPGDYGINSLAVFDDGGGPALYLGGSFLSPATRLARFRPDGYATFPLGVYGSVIGAPVATTENAAQHTGVLAMAVFDDGSGSGPALFLGGDFTGAGGTNSSALAKWATPWSCAPPPPPVTLSFTAPAEDATVTTASPQLALAFSPPSAVASTLAILDGGAALGIACTFGGGAALCTPAAALAAGTHHLSATIADANGDVSAPATVDFVVAPLAPVLAWTSPAAGAMIANATPVLGLSWTAQQLAVVPSTLAITANGSTLAVTCTFGISTAQCTPAAPLADGLIALAATIQDVDGNASAPATRTFRIDTQPPTVLFTQPAPGAVLATSTPTVTFTLSDSGSGVDVSAVRVWATGTGSYTFNCNFQANGGSCAPPGPVSDGTITLLATAADLAGNISPQASVTFVVDTQAPALAWSAPAAGSATNNTTPSLVLTYADAGTGVDSSTLAITANGTPLAVACTFGLGGATCTPAAPLAAGTVALQATIADRAGHVSTPAVVSFLVDPDFTPPVITLTNPPSGGATNQATQVLSGQLSKAATLTVNGAAVTVRADSAFATGLLTLAEGTNTFLWVATDAVGNVGKLTTTLTLDTQPPQLTFVVPQPGSYFNPATQAVLFGWSDVGTGIDVTTLALTANGQPLGADCQQSSSGGGVTCVVTGALPSGTVQLAAVVRDRAGNSSPAATVTCSTDITSLPPSLTLLSPPANGTVATPQVVLRGLLNRPATLIANGQSWPVGSDLSFAVGPLTLAAGSNSVTLAATDATGLVGTLSFTLTLDASVPATGVSGSLTVAEVAVGLQEVTASSGWVSGASTGTQVVIRNLATGTEVSAPVGLDGSFATDAAAMPGDVLRLWVVNAAGTASPTRDVTVLGTQPVAIDPASVAPPLPAVLPASVACALAGFYWQGASPVQFGVQAASVDCTRLAVVHGTVVDTTGAPLGGVRVEIAGQPVLGFTLTRSDGAFDLVAHGGERVILRYSAPGYLPVQRLLPLAWGQFATAPRVALAAPDTTVTAIDLTQTQGVQVARGSVVTDGDGTRRATLLFAPGVTAQMGFPDGSTQPITNLAVRATELSQGTFNSAAVPADLTAGEALGYVVDLAVDAAVAAGATSVTFSQAVPLYVEDFLALPVGQALGAAWLDREHTSWVPQAGGLVVQIVSVTGGLADLDLTGGGQPAAAADLAALGVTDGERQALASLYPVGQTLWRLPVAHFSAWDFSWTLAGSAPPVPVTEVPTAGDDRKIDHSPGEWVAGDVESDNQILGQALDLVGTPFSLTYQSDRVPGRNLPYTLSVPLRSATQPAGATAIQVDLNIAGQEVVQSFPPTTTQPFTFVWNRLDGFGRQLQGPAPWTAQVSYLSGSGRTSVITSRTFAGILGSFDARAVVGLGGWTLADHHFYDLPSGTLYYGDGGRRSLRSAVNQPQVLNLVAGTGAVGGAGDGGQARAAQLAAPTGLAVTHDGSLLIADAGTCRVRKVTTDGVISTVAGTLCNPNDDGTKGTGDGGPATSAVLGAPIKAVEGTAPDYAIYIADRSGERIRQVDAKGIITTVAGDGTWGCTGGNQLAYPVDLAVEASGSLLIANQGITGSGVASQSCDSILRLAPGGGGLSTVVGYFFYPDGSSGVELADKWPAGVAAGRDGSVYFTPVSALVRRPANGGSDPQHPDWIVGGLNRFYLPGDTVFAGDGLPASQVNTRFYAPTHLAIAPDGSIYVADFDNQRIRKVSPAEIVSTVAGGGTLIPAGDGVAATQAALQAPFGVALDGTGTVLYISDTALHQVWKLLLPGAPGATNGSSVPSEDGSQIYFFDAQGFHLRTQTAVTGKAVLSFTYADFPQASAPPRHLLTQVVDAAGNATTIQRAADGTPLAVVGPFGQTTTLQVDGNGYLSTVTRSGETVQLVNTSGGLLTSLTDPLSGVYAFTYDSHGRLTSTADPARGGLGLTTQSPADNDVVVQEASAGGQNGQVEALTPADQPGQASVPPANILLQHTLTDPAGLATRVQQTRDGVFNDALPGGTAATAQTLADLQLGALATYIGQQTVTLPSGLHQTKTTSRLEAIDPGNPLAVTAWSESATLNGRTFTTAVDNSQSKVTQTSPTGRQLVTLFDGLGRATQQQVAGIDPVAWSYDGFGRLATVQQGTRTTTYAYGNDGFLASVRDPLGHQVQYQHDAVGRVLQETLPDGRVVGFAYDTDGNLTSVTPPARTAHAFAFDGASDLTAYAPPGFGRRGRRHDLCLRRRPRVTSVTRPDQQTITLAYDAAGRLASLTTPSGVTNYGYSPADGGLLSITAPGGSTITYTRDGPLVTGITATGPGGGTVQTTFDHAGDGSSNLWPTTLTLNGDAAGSTPFDFDNDGLLVTAGELQLWRDPANGSLEGTELLDTGDTYHRTEYGEVDHFQSGFADGSCTPSGPPPVLGCFDVFEEILQRDRAGRITQLTENQRDPITAATSSHTVQYTYDADSRLTAVNLDGAAYESYTYDANGNRTAWTDPWSTVTGAAYDAQDRLLAAGPTTYTYTPNGELLTKSQGGAVLTYTYDVLGNLRTVALPSGIQVGYAVDGRNRRTGILIDGALVEGFLYGDGPQPLAQLDASGAVVSTFLYGEGNAPDALLQHGVTYRLVKDHRGSVRLVYNASTGNVLQALDYDAYGRVTLDTNPGFQSFGFAGGLYDYRTGLVRFGARDYDPETGRWTSKDPLLFGGGDTGLYTYVADDPINATDPDGTDGDDAPLEDTIPTFNLVDYFYLGGLFHSNAWSFFEGATSSPGGIVHVKRGWYTAGLLVGLLFQGPESELEGSLIKGSSRILARNMIEEGATRGAGEVAHHIVAKGARFAKASVKILQRLGIEIDHAANGVFLKASQHARLHTKAYYEAVYRALSTAKTREEAIAFLRAIATRLKQGGFP
jgi:RHS repeat-associated protein